MKKTDILIMGAGPAGASCALALARRGLKVLIIDKSVFPRPKVCGGFVGPQAKELLLSLGLRQELCRRGAVSIEKSVLYAPSGASVSISMGDEAAFGCSRLMLDDLLLQRLKDVQIEVMEGATVMGIYGGSGLGFEVDIDHHHGYGPVRVSAEHLIDARGHASYKFNLGLRQLGISALYEDIPFLKGQVSLFCCHQGHVGVNPFEGGMVNICYVVEAGHFEANGSDAQKVLDSWLMEHKPLQAILKGIKRLSSWKAVCLPVRNEVRLFESGIWRVGDSAAFIDPVTGGGMGVALLAGQLLADAITAHDNDEDRLKSYTRDYFKCFSKQRLLARLWGALAHHPFSSEAVVRLLDSHNLFKSQVIHYSHPRSLTQSILQY